MSGFQHAAGEAIGPYELEAPIGRGGFSEVWRARRMDEGGPAQVALKLLIHPEHVAQLRAEANLLSLAKGAGILTVHEVNLLSDPPYLALELANFDLRSMLRVSSLDVVAAVHVVEKVLEILERVHREGIVHGDLKPENILIRGTEPVLADFGLSRRVSQRSASLSVSLSREDMRLAGTLDYMAPEQRAGEKPTPRSDVFAAGVLLYELVTGERPQGVFALPSEKDPRIPPVVDRVIACSLAPDPAHRFASAGAMLGFLRAGLQNDWKDLAEAHARTGAILAGLRASDARALLVLFGLLFTGTLGLVLIMDGPPLATRLYEASFPLVPLALFSVSLLILRPWLVRREARLEKLRGRIARQIAAKPDWQGRLGKPRKPRVRAVAPPPRARIS